MEKAPLTGPGKSTGARENLFLNVGLRCQLLPPGPSPLISGFWQEVDWKLEANQPWPFVSTSGHCAGALLLGRGYLTWVWPSAPPTPLENHKRRFRVTGQRGRSGVRLLEFTIRMCFNTLICTMGITVSTIPGVGVKIKRDNVCQVLIK